MDRRLRHLSDAAPIKLIGRYRIVEVTLVQGSDELLTPSAPARYTSSGNRVALCGSFGYGNAGDEAIPLALADLCRRILPSMEFRVVSRFDHVALDNVTPLASFDDRFLVEEGIHEVWHVGGGIVEPGRRSVLERCSKVPPSVNQRLICANVANGVRYNFLSRNRIRHYLRRCASISVRDVESQESCGRNFGFPEVPVIGDLALCLEPAEVAVEDYNLGFANGFIVCNFCPVWRHLPTFTAWAGQVVTTAASMTGCQVALVPMSEMYDSDTSIHRAILETLSPATRKRVCLVENVQNPRVIAGIISRAKLVVAMRLHANVFAFSSSVPFIGIAYSKKVRGFAETSGNPSSILEPCRSIPFLKSSSTRRTVRDFDANACPMLKVEKAIEEARDAFSFDALAKLKSRVTAEVCRYAQIGRTKAN